MLLDQLSANNVHAGEEVNVVENSSTAPSTSVENGAAADARRESNLYFNESTISYDKTRCSPESEPFR